MITIILLLTIAVEIGVFGFAPVPTLIFSAIGYIIGYTIGRALFKD